MKLEADSLTLARGGRTIIDRLSFEAPGGRSLILTGPNGAGKTTLIRAIAGFLAPVSGKVVLEGGASGRSLAEQCHYVGHLNGLKSSLTVAENLGFWADYLSPHAVPAMDPPPPSSRVENALAAFELDRLADIPAGYLSAGQKRRVGLARLLAAERPVWLLDEPTVSLDARSTVRLAGEIDRHTAAGGIAIAATHLALGLERSDELRLGVKSEAA